MNGDTVKIEPLRQHPEWIPNLARWHHGEWAVFNPGETLADRVGRLERDAADDDLPLTWVASAGGVLLGSASLVVSDMDTRPSLTPWLASVFVSPDHRGQGLGSRLVEHVVREAEGRKFAQLFLFTPDRESFYQRLGWRVVERLEYQKSFVILMALDIAPAARTGE